MWIKFSERLPDVNDDILTWDPTDKFGKEIGLAWTKYDYPMDIPCDNCCPRSKCMVQKEFHVVFYNYTVYECERVITIENAVSQGWLWHELPAKP